ncbi:aminopeptidase N [Chitinivibrio alkaliphilus]|uniref:Aminopeptidase N n=1 Tax=Chitinivibrio alkaliphilus ACht1 TaxID=1313304 RepID=U7D407_9BACT|nr:aminopeptidase N [Chitinivibrio alkaliphilus]ERP30683.1 aminopeptidase N [Chitinivibrio alkaliphilus ACht1]
MSSPSVQRRSDYTPPAFYVDAVSLDIVLADHATRVSAVLQVRRTTPNTAHMTLHGHPSVVLEGVTLNGTPWHDFEHTDDRLLIRNCPDTFELVITTTISPADNTAFEGLYKSAGAFCTQCEAEGFRRIVFYPDRPDVLARFTTRITAPKKEYPLLLSNGNRVKEEDLGGGVHRVTWVDPVPKPSYLFALVAGDFDCLRDYFVTASGKEVALELYVDRGMLHRAHHAMESLKHAMRWDETRFSLEYDLGIYMIVAVDFFNMGAMENKGLNIFNAKYVLADRETATDQDFMNIEAVIGHEYFHNWTGNRITCRDWFELSLKEGLTVFRDQEFSADRGSRAVHRIKNVRMIRSHQFREDAGPMAHPIRPEEVIEMSNFYTVTIYEKGAEVIRMIHTLLGENRFQEGMQTYVRRHDGHAVTCEDFIAAMEAGSGEDLTQFRRWYSQAGTPEVRASYEWDRAQKTLRLTLCQKTPPTADKSPKKPLHIPVNTALFSKTGERIPLVRAQTRQNEVLSLQQATQTWVFEEVDTAPVVSLFRGFSAPVRLIHPLETEDLHVLILHEEDDFSRWDAWQMLLKKEIVAMVSAMQGGKTVQVPPSVCEIAAALVEDQSLDPAFVAEMLTLPAESELAGWFDTVPVEAIHHVRQALRDGVAHGCASVFSARYAALHQDSFEMTTAAMAQRSLRNTLLGYLALVPSGSDQVAQHFAMATSMTDSIGALEAAIFGGCSCRDRLLEEFAHRWSKDGLVMDKWFSLQAVAPAMDTLKRVKELMNHPTFDHTNPNRVRSLIGAFTARNHRCFHAEDGTGYRFLREQIELLNSRNPQVASQLIDPLLQFARYDLPRRTCMVEQLHTLRAMPDISSDIYEKVHKALKSSADS